MKTFAHRGWSAGTGENTLASFQKSLEANLDGVEFDVRCGTDGKTVVLSHDKVSSGEVLTLDEALQFLAPTSLELLIECKEYTPHFYKEVICQIHSHNLVGRATIFAFPEIARYFPWDTRGDIKLGIIAPYPQDIKKYKEKYAPDMILLGWGNEKERVLFKIVWSFLSLSNIFTKYSSIKFVIGVTYTKKDKEWLSQKEGLYGTTVDMPLL